MRRTPSEARQFAVWSLRFWLMRRRTTAVDESASPIPTARAPLDPSGEGARIAQMIAVALRVDTTPVVTIEAAPCLSAETSRCIPIANMSTMSA